MKKGTKQKKTILKEKLGLTGWQQLLAYMENEGPEKAVTELSELDGKDFINAYSALAEFVKPKLNRTTLVGEKENPIPVIFQLDERFKDSKDDTGIPT